MDKKIGYKSPPAHTQYKKGQSGNPSGRPKGTKNFKTDLLEELSEQVVIREGDQALKISKQRAVIKRLTSKALQGDASATHTVLGYLWKIFEKENPEENSEELAEDDVEILQQYLKRKGDKNAKRK
jgi:hypothetical protein